MPGISILTVYFRGILFSPILFCVALIPLSKLLNNTGYVCKIYDNTMINHLFYMDDLKLFAKNEQQVQWASSGILYPPNFISLYSIRFFRRKKCCCVIHFCLVFLVSVTLLVFITEGSLLGEGLVWAASCPLFTGDFDPVANISTPAWSNSEEHAPFLSMRQLLLSLLLLLLLLLISEK